MSGRPADRPPGDPAPLREDALTEAAFLLASTPSDGRLDPLLHFASHAAALLTGASAAVVVLASDGSVDRFVADGADGCTRDTLTRPEVLASLTGRFRGGAAVVRLADLDEPVARLLHAIAPRGFVALPLGLAPDAMLVVLKPRSGPKEESTHGDGFDDDVIGAAQTLALLAGAALDTARRLGAIREASEGLQRVVAHLSVRRDQELGRTARRLHEGIGQSLAGANAQLEALEKLLPATDGDAARARLHDARVLLERTAGELRDLAQELRPSVLDDFGYVQALRWYVARLRCRDHVAVSLKVEGTETRFAPAVEGALFRATEQVLAAVRGNGGAPVRIRYRRDGRGVRVEIAGPLAGDLSLVEIREHLRPFGGAVHASREPAALAFVLPFDQPPSAN